VLLTLAASTLIMTGALGQWRVRASQSQKRDTMVRNAVRLAGALVFAWISMRLYAPLAHWLYEQFGKTFFEIGLLFGVPRGIVQLAVTLFVMLLISIGLGFLFRKVQRSAERFLAKQFELGEVQQR